MLSIHYVSIMMRIFYIDWQQHWECHRTVNIGEQQNSHKWQTSVDQLGFQWHRRGIELVFKSLDCFTKRLFHTTTIFCCYICICCLKLDQADYKVEEFFLFFLTSIWWGSTQLQCIHYLRRILISRPPRVFRRFKRRSCVINRYGRKLFISLQWRHYECGGISNHLHLNCFLNHLFRRRSKKKIKAPRQWPLWGKSTGDEWILLAKNQ